MKLILADILLLVILSGMSRAQVIRLNPQGKFRPQLGGGTIAISATPSNITFNLVPGGVASGSSGISIQSTFSGLSLLSSVSLYAYFVSTDALTDSAGDILPSSDVYGTCPTGKPASYTAFTQMGPYSSGSSLLVWQSNSILSLGSGRTDVLSLRINLGATPQLPAGSYIGTLNLQVQAF